nr:MAG TPA: tail protein [Caudoviricetes sp.]
MSKTTIIYKDVAPGAESDASVTTTASETHSDPAMLPTGVSPSAVITLEHNSWTLNGTRRSIDTQPLAFWSEEISGEDGTFQAPPTITVEFDSQYTSVGISLVFDTALNEWCSSVNIKWYQGETLKSSKDFAPDAPTYFCQHNVASYDKVIITLNRTRLPGRRAKLSQIAFGVIRTFGMTEIRKASIVNVMDLAALSLPSSTLSWTLDSKADVDYIFQLKQPVEVRNDDQLIGVYYIDQASRSGPRLYTIDCYDAIGVLDESAFPGGYYSGKSAKALLEEILGDSFTLDFQGTDAAVTGIIQACTKREALQQVAFAAGLCLSTDGSHQIKAFSPGSTATEIPKTRVYTGASVKTAAIVTEVRVTAHAYTQDSSGGIEIGGVKYKDTPTVYTVTNPDVTATDKSNIIEITDATLVSASIGQAVAQRVYDYYNKRNTYSGKIVWRGEALGDCLTLPNTWGGTNTGHVIRMSINLSNTVAATCESIGE